MPYLLLYVVLELAALVAVASWLGFLGTLLLLVAGGLLGMWLVRREGARAAFALATAVRAGRVPHAEVTDGALIGLAGLLILLPGVVSDVLGLLLVLPPTRALVRGRLVTAAERRSPVLRTIRIHDGRTVVDGVVVGGPVSDGSGVHGGQPSARPWTWDELPRPRSIEG